METSLTVIEAYLSGAFDHDSDYYEGLVARVRAAMRPHGLDASLLVLPDDETLLWLVRAASSSSARDSSAGDFDIRGAVATATATAAGHLIERQLTGRLVDAASPVVADQPNG